jgi:NitT/TauT family transport system substrate-binding protein
MTWIPYFQKKLGISFNLVPNTYNITSFLADSNTIQQCLVTNEPFFVDQRGVKVRVLGLTDSGYDCYQVLFCRRELIRDRPDVVAAFVQASIRGWRNYLEANPVPAHDLILARNPQMSAAQLNFSRRELILRSLVHGDPTKGEGIGQISLSRLAIDMHALLELKVLERPVPISTVATTQFLPAPGR